MSNSKKKDFAPTSRVSKEECEREGIPYGRMVNVNFKHPITEKEFVTVKSVFERMGVENLLDYDGGFLADMQLTDFAPLMAKLPIIAAQQPYNDEISTQISLLSELLYSIQKNQNILGDLAHLLTELNRINEECAE